jgi:hypothetical protein
MRSQPLRLAALTVFAITLAPIGAQTDWTQLAPLTSPSLHTKGQLTHLITTGNVLLFGGIDNTQTYLDETWTFDGANWTQENPLNVPRGRIQSRMVHDLVRNVAVMWSGYPGGAGYVQDLWEWVPNNGVQAKAATGYR